ncbi:MAG TPA: hypothetical protein VJM74_07210 [Nitrososphaeraceae archaeon]|nr:hypothetical protein [Nitrososphaeraceae archaeon]
MSNAVNRINYIKHNSVRIKRGVQREAITRIILEFFGTIKNNSTGMKGFIVMDDLEDKQESVVITFWERKEDMDTFYRPENKLLRDLVKKLNPSFERLPVRNDYHVAKFEA